MTTTMKTPRQSDEWLKAAESALGTGFWTWRVEEAQLGCSPGLYQLAGVNSESVQMDLKFFESLVHPKDRLTSTDNACLATDPRQSNRRFRLIRPDGTLRWFHSIAQSYFDRSGTVTRVVAAVIDVTDQQAVNLQSSRLEALLLSVSKLTGTALWIAAGDGELLERFNANDVIDLMADGGGQPHWRNVIHPDDVPRMQRAWKLAAENRQTYRFHGRVLMADGHYRDLHAVGLPFDPHVSTEPLWGGISSGDTKVFDGEVASETTDPTLLTPGQVRACRALLDWTAETLASKAGISVSTVRRLESVDVSQGQGDSMRLVMLAFRDEGLKIWRSDNGRFCVSDNR